jgi:signal transduction histidine kinase
MGTSFALPIGIRPFAARSSVAQNNIIRFPKQDLNAILRNGVGISCYFKPDRINLRLDPQIPLLSGIIVNPADNYQKDPQKGWGSTLQAVIFMHMMQNSSKAQASSVQISTLLVNDRVHIYVSDNGCGISKLHEKKLFTKDSKFGYLNQIAQNNGNGLYFSKIAIEKLGGTIDLARNVPFNEATAENPSGVTFRITLPIFPSV